MPNEISVALIGASASIVCALIARTGAVQRGKKATASTKAIGGHPAMVFFVVLGVGLSLTALFFAYVATGGGPPSEVTAAQLLHNTSRRPYFLTLSCNSTLAKKTLTARMANTEKGLAEDSALVVSESGDERLASSAVVPSGFFYRVDVTQVPGLGCKLRQWPL
jgi:hypothetical protein